MAVTGCRFLTMAQVFVSVEQPQFETGMWTEGTGVYSLCQTTAVLVCMEHV